ncbi:MAG: ABC transporter substrate-binding protein [Actinomycetota bacterium]
MRLIVLLAALGLVAAACGEGAEEPAPPEEVTIIHGTTDPWQSFDPAASYDLPSWNVIQNVMETLLAVPPGGTAPEPQLAESCDFEDPQTYTCSLKQGVTFHDGSTFEGEDVKFSFDRNIGIADPEGASSLLASLDEVEVVDDSTVTFHLAQDDATWPFILTTAAAAIVPSDAYSETEVQDDQNVIGTGPYQVAEFRPGEQLVLEAFADYHGEPPANSRVIVQLFDTSAALKLAVEQGEVDIAYRNLTPTEIEDLRGQEGIEVVEGTGTEIRYLVFNLAHEPFDELAVRQAIAMTIDRQAIVENVYEGTVEPLYSMNPVGLAGHIDAFAMEYGETADPDVAAQLLSDAGTETPLELEIWWTPSHYGDLSADEYAEIKRSLEASGLFTVNLRSTEWDAYTGAAFGEGEQPGDGSYPAYQLGWFPDYPDADNYLASFYSSDSFLNNAYSNNQVDQLIATERASTDQGDRVAAFEQIQQIAAEEVPIIPIWQGDQVAAQAEGITGTEETFDASFIFRYWLIGKTA